MVGFGDPAPQFPQNSETYHAGYNTEQVPAMNYFPAENANQDAPTGWRFDTCWVSYAEGDEIQFTIALKRV